MEWPSWANANAAKARSSTRSSGRSCLPSEDDPLNLLQQLAEGQWNGWQNPAFEEACRQESENFTLQGSAARAARLEEQLIVECPVTPLFYETDYLLVDPKVSGLVFQPFGPILDVSGAKQ